MKIPILTYHAMDIAGNDYHNNEHVAFAHDIEQIDALGFEIVPLSNVVEALEKAPHTLGNRRLVALTCDDGSDFDYRDLPHPTAGIQRSMLNILRDFRASKPGSQALLFATFFVIVSPSARDVLDTKCMIGKKWWNDDWWKAAIDSGLAGIGNHSWDHNHDCIEDVEFPSIVRGTFRTIDTFEAADFQIARASEFLWQSAPNASASLLAYPYGESNEFLVREYFPRRGGEIRITAAFGDSPEPLHEGSNRWNLPRYISRRDWKSPEGLRKILDEALR